MKLLSKAAIALGLAAALLTPRASSQAAQPSAMAAQSEQESGERWEKMSPQEKQEMRERFQRWKNLDPKEKADLQR